MFGKEFVSSITSDVSGLLSNSLLTIYPIDLGDLKTSLETDINILESDRARMEALKTRIKSSTNSAAYKAKNASSGKGGDYDPNKGSNKGSKKEPKLFDASKYDESNNLLEQIDAENDRQNRL
jgi:hypothetical protein